MEDRKRLATFHHLTERYLRGEYLTDKELMLLKNVSLSGDEYATDADIAETLHTERSVWAALQARINDTVQSNPRRPTVRPFRRYVAAAIMILAVVAGGFAIWQHTRIDEVRLMATNNPKAVTLPDGSTVYLNVGTTLSYDANRFNRKRREVRLDGEAFFEVTKNPEKPFSVQGGEVVTTVRGTSFNVKAYATVKENVISVRDGKVEVSNVDKGTLAVLTQNQQLTWNVRTHTSSRDSIDWRAAAGWKDGKVLFNEAGLDEIALKMRRYYGVSLVAEALHDADIHLCGTYPSDDGGATLLRQLKDIYGISSENNGSRVTLHR